jgi:hypothetical protein
MRSKAHAARPARRRVGIGKRARGFSPLRQRPVWSFLSEGPHSEAARRRGQALAEERHLHFGKEDCCIATRQGPLVSPESRNSPSIFILHTTLFEGLEPQRSAGAAAATRHPSSFIASSWEPPDAPHRRALLHHPLHPKGRALYIGMLINHARAPSGRGPFPPEFGLMGLLQTHQSPLSCKPSGSTLRKTQIKTRFMLFVCRT